jgi:8-oxo-dGTP pyrophosphatase MutT (NUDIX family)
MMPAMPGPALRTDVVEVYVFRRTGVNPAAGAGAKLELLQMRRAAGTMLGGTWQPIMGHVEADETAVACALRELAEETGYAPDAGLLGLWQLEEPNVYFLAGPDCIMLGPCFVAEVDPVRAPVLDGEHDAVRWVPRDAADRMFLWPGQRKAVSQLVRDILEPGSPVEPVLRLPLEHRGR